jgi:hypothetical protein
MGFKYVERICGLLLSYMTMNFVSSASSISITLARVVLFACVRGNIYILLYSRNRVIVIIISLSMKYPNSPEVFVIIAIYLRDLLYSLSL